MHPRLGNIIAALVIVVVIGCLLNPTMTTIYLAADTVVDRRVAGVLLAHEAGVL